MPIRYEPSKILRKVAPAAKIERALKDNLSLKKTALRFTEQFDFLDSSKITDVALKTVKGYRERVKNDPDQREEILDDPAQLVQRVQNEVITQVAEGIRGRYGGEFYTWLPSDADEPDPEHQLNYGETFQIGVGEMPGDRYGCQCGMEIQVAENELDL